MRQVETDLNANRYQNALRHRDVLVDDLDDEPDAARQPRSTCNRTRRQRRG